MASLSSEGQLLDAASGSPLGTLRLEPQKAHAIGVGIVEDAARSSCQRSHQKQRQQSEANHQMQSQVAKLVRHTASPLSLNDNH